MIVRLIPENEEEKARAAEIELTGVREFFLIGNFADEEGTLTEFHEWNGSYRYLQGSLGYYSEVLNDERREAIARRSIADTVGPQLKVIPSEADTPFEEDGEKES